MLYLDQRPPATKRRQPRDYQTACILAAQKSLDLYPSSLIVLPTGCGKTFVFSRIADEWKHGNVLIVAHRIELVDQAAHSLSLELGYEPMIEQAERGCDYDSLHQGGMIVVGSIQTMITPRRINKFRDFPFGLIVVDEAHRATAPMYKRLVEHYRKLNDSCRVLGVTATPNRSDKTALGLVFDDVAYNMGIVEGIDGGWLVDIHQKFASLEHVDLSHIRSKRNEFGEMDFNQEDLAKVLEEEGPLHEMSRPLLDITTGGEQAIVFAASVKHAHLWAMVLNRYRPGCAASVDGQTDKMQRHKTVDDFRAGDLQFLLNYGVFTEGFDAPVAKMVVMGRPTKSLLTYTQMLGRGTRPLPGLVDGLDTAEERQDAISASAKPWLTVLDFVGNSKHKIVTATDVLGGNYDVETKERAKARLGSKQGNVREAIRKAKALHELLAEEYRRRGVRFDGINYTLEDVDPFGAHPVGVVPFKATGGATPGQLSLLVGLGVDADTAQSYSRKQAGAVLSSLKASRCTVRQADVLARFGYNPKNFNMEQASEMIDKIAKNGWRRT